MIKLIFFELQKLWRNKSFIFGVMVILLVNFLMLFIYGQTTSKDNAQAYKKMTQELTGLSMDEKQSFINELYRRIDAINTIDQILRIESNGISEYSKALRKENSDVFKEFQAQYNAGSYLLYTDNLYNEHFFISEIKKELDTVASYEDYLKRIAEKADNLSQISIFKTESGDSFSEKSIRAQAAAYENMENIQTNYLPEKGIMSALEFRLSDVLLFAFVLLMASVLLREEKDSGMLALTFSLPGGRGKTALAKLGAVFISLIGIVFALYIMNLMYYQRIYGLGSLDRAVQSLPSLIQCTWQLTVGQYIGIFLITKWLSAVIVSAWLMLCTYIAKNIYTGWGTGLAFIGLNYIIRNSVSGIGHFNLFKYINIFSFMNTNEVLGSYIQLYFFGNPIPILWSECLGGALFTLLFCGLFVYVFQQGRSVFLNRPLTVIARDKIVNGSRDTKNRSLNARLMGHELYKLLKINGAGVVFGIFILFLVFQMTQSTIYISFDEEIYKNYMKQWSGRVTAQTIELINKENKQFEPLYELEDALTLGILTSEQYKSALESYAVLEQEKNIFDQIVRSKFSYLESHPKAWLVYDTGYTRLFDINDKDDVYEMMLLILVLIFGFGNVFSMEKMTGMEQILSTTPLGQKRLARTKLFICYVLTTILAIISLIPRYLTVGINFGFNQLLAPAQSLESFSYVPYGVSIYHLILIQIFFRVMTALTAVSFILFLSSKMRNTLIVYFISAMILELCLLLNICGVESLKWLSLWPIFHLPTALSGGMPVLLLVLYGIFYFGFAVAARDEVINKFCMPAKIHVPPIWHIGRRKG